MLHIQWFSKPKYQGVWTLNSPISIRSQCLLQNS